MAKARQAEAQGWGLPQVSLLSGLGPAWGKGLTQLPFCGEKPGRCLQGPAFHCGPAVPAGWDTVVTTQKLSPHSRSPLQITGRVTCKGSWHGPAREQGRHWTSFCRALGCLAGEEGTCLEGFLASHSVTAGLLGAQGRARYGCKNSCCSPTWWAASWVGSDFPGPSVVVSEAPQCSWTKVPLCMGCTKVGS